MLLSFDVWTCFTLENLYWEYLSWVDLRIWSNFYPSSQIKAFCPPSSQEDWVLLPVHCENTRRTESPGPPSPRPSCWPWRGSSARSSTFPSPSAQSSPVPWTWRRPRSRSGFRTGEPKPSGCRRQNLKNWKWQRSRCCLQPSGFPFPSVRTSPGPTQGRTRSRGTRCPFPPWDCTPLTSDTVCTTWLDRDAGRGARAVGHKGG